MDDASYDGNDFDGGDDDDGLFGDDDLDLQHR